MRREAYGTTRLCHQQSTIAGKGTPMKTLLPACWLALLATVQYRPATAAEAIATPAVAVVQEAIAPDPDAGMAAARVREALRRADAPPGEEVIVSTHSGTIVLTGELGSEVEVARTVSLAEQAADGVRVSSQITLRPTADDAARQAAKLAREVEMALRQDGRTASLGVVVSIDDETQMIGLHGLVPSVESRRAAEDVAARVAGVKRVRSQLVVPGE